MSFLSNRPLMVDGWAQTNNDEMELLSVIEAASILMQMKMSSFNNIAEQESTDDDNFSSQSEAGSIDAESATISIGPNNTRIPATLYQNLDWSSASKVTRKLLMAIFDRNVLATHSMTGKPSPAFKDLGKPVKEMLEPRVIADIIHVVTRNCNVSEKEVRNAITTKCADENKMMKLQMNKRTPMSDLDINREPTIME